ncbi:interleukin-17C-like [Gouania willdenowi]|uniref:Interleukin-17C-like n=1 Tax=Gouania willdenowi TaxID=441366 RepID=A0A8C5G3N6_GOUWI|nr:interleukin-17C-like [Gouania willdenowi]
MHVFSLKTLSLCAWLGVGLTDSTGCLNEEQVQWRKTKYERDRERIVAASRELSVPGPGPRTCAEAARMRFNESVSHRSLSPWTYREDRHEDRFPEIIPFAECLCHGCIVGGKEDSSYNSILVVTTQQVLIRSPCSTDKSKYAITKDFIKVPVACTCVHPKVTRS